MEYHITSPLLNKQENAIVERVNKEVNRHLRGLVFDKQTLEGYAKSIPFVQRIIDISLIDAQVFLPLIYCSGVNLI